MKKMKASELPVGSKFKGADERHPLRMFNEYIRASCFHVPVPNAVCGYNAAINEVIFFEPDELVIPLEFPSRAGATSADGMNIEH